MNPVQLHYAKIVADTGSFSDAAQVCGVSQSTVSDAVSELEHRLGAKLFKRTARRLDLTSFGRKIIGNIEGVLDAVSELEQRARTLLNPKHKILRVAHARLVDMQRMVAMFEPFQRAHPDLEITYKECRANDLETRLDEEKADLICGIGLRDLPNRARCVLHEDVLHYLPRGGLPVYRGTPIISIKDAACEPLILTDAACSLAAFTRDLFHRTKTKFQEHTEQAASYQMAQEWSQLGIGAALLPESRIQGNTFKYPVVASNRGPLIISYEAVWDKNAPAPVHVQEFLKYLQAAVGPIVKGGGKRTESQRKIAHAHAV